MALSVAKARYFGTAISAAIVIFQKGAEAKLHAGDTIEVASRRGHQHAEVCPEAVSVGEH
jgi:hypothetical protein